MKTDDEIQDVILRVSDITIDAFNYVVNAKTPISIDHMVKRYGMLLDLILPTLINMKLISVKDNIVSLDTYGYILVQERYSISNVQN